MKKKTTNKSFDVPGIGTFSHEHDSVFAAKDHKIKALGGKSYAIELAGYEDDKHPEDFHAAVRNLLEADKSLLEAATPYVHQYCEEMLELLGDDAPKLKIKKPADVWKHVDLGFELSVERDHGKSRDVFVSLECNCAWEEGHGLQLVFKNGKEISKVGPFDGHLSNASAYADPKLKSTIYKSLKRSKRASR